MGWTAKLFFSSALLRTNVLGNGVPSTPHGVVFFSPSSEARFKCRPHRQSSRSTWSTSLPTETPQPKPLTCRPA